MRKYTIENWKQQLTNAEAADTKEPIYALLRPLISFSNSLKLKRSSINLLKPNMVLPESGFPLIARRRWAAANEPLGDKTILVQGTGNGWDVVSWAKLGPKKVIGTDLFDFDCWQDIIAHADENLKSKVEFHASPVEYLGFLEDESIDIAASDAVFEHLKNFEEAMKETYRVLKPGGLVSATYGPLWFCAGGDHFAKGGLKNVFNHVGLDKEDYDSYFQQYRSAEESFQSGGRYVELDLFSKLRTDQYIELFKNAGFVVESLILEISKMALTFRKMFPKEFLELKERNPDCSEDDFLIKANFVRLRKPL